MPRSVTNAQETPWKSKLVCIYSALWKTIWRSSGKGEGTMKCSKNDSNSRPMQRPSCLLKTIQTLTLHATFKLFTKDDSNSHTSCSDQAVYQRRLKLFSSMQWSVCLPKTIQTTPCSDQAVYQRRLKLFSSMQWSVCLSKTIQTHTPCTDLAVYQKFKLSHSWSGWVEADVLYSWISGQPVERSKMRRDMISFGNSENKTSKIVLKFSYFLITFFFKEILRTARQDRFSVARSTTINRHFKHKPNS